MYNHFICAKYVEKSFSNKRVQFQSEVTVIRNTSYFLHNSVVTNAKSTFVNLHMVINVLQSSPIVAYTP